MGERGPHATPGCPWCRADWGSEDWFPSSSPQRSPAQSCRVPASWPPGLPGLGLLRDSHWWLCPHEQPTRVPGSGLLCQPWMFSFKERRKSCRTVGSLRQGPVMPSPPETVGGAWGQPRGTPGSAQEGQAGSTEVNPRSGTFSLSPPRPRLVMRTVGSLSEARGAAQGPRPAEGAGGGGRTRPSRWGHLPGLTAAGVGFVFVDVGCAPRAPPDAARLAGWGGKQSRMEGAGPPGYDVTRAFGERGARLTGPAGFCLGSESPSHPERGARGDSLSGAHWQAVGTAWLSPNEGRQVRRTDREQV